ncbi:hypothetical protein CFC21_035330 [Triticum aestivum]|uniref:Uncharacterized protein n=3 Tax=Triticum TaxID=4564 RepID=A0A9R0RIG1_TRITD|nr:hypothetical protein CFC21_035330 [Triticum aestivum]VAH61188.1 unnamed protein product [Triticum turgidum subsp. durum]
MPRTDPGLPCIAPLPLAQGSPPPVPGPALSRWLRPSALNLWHSSGPAKPHRHLPPATRRIETSCTPCGGAASATPIANEHHGLEVQRLIEGTRWREVGSPASCRRPLPKDQCASRQSWAVFGVGEGGVSGGANGRSCDDGGAGAATVGWGK